MENKPTFPATEDELIAQIVALIEQGRNSVVRQTNAIMALTYFEIGKHIVEFEQNGKARAKYAKKTLETLSQREFGIRFKYKIL